MFMKSLLILVSLVMILSLAPAPLSAQDDPITIGFLPGVVDPFYQVMELGVNAAAEDMGVQIITQIPQSWGVEVQTPILDAMIARGDLDYLIIAPTDKDQMIGPLEAALDAGIQVITVDTFLGDGDYVNGPVTFPISYIGSDKVEGGRIAARGLAAAIGGTGKVYINSTNPNVSSVEGRAVGFNEVMANEYPDIEVVGLDFNLDDPARATEQTAAVIAREPDLGGVFGTTVQRPGCWPGRHPGRSGWAGLGRRLRRHPARDREPARGRGFAGAGPEALRHGLYGRPVCGRPCGRRDQPAEARPDRVRHHRHQQCRRSGNRSLHLPGSLVNPKGLTASRMLPATSPASIQTVVMRSCRCQSSAPTERRTEQTRRPAKQLGHTLAVCGLGLWAC